MFVYAIIKEGEPQTQQNPQIQAFYYKNQIMQGTYYNLVPIAQIKWRFLLSKELWINIFFVNQQKILQ